MRLLLGSLLDCFTSRCLASQWKFLDCFICPWLSANSGDMIPKVGTLIFPLGKSLTSHPSLLVKD